MTPKVELAVDLVLAALSKQHGRMLTVQSLADAARRGEACKYTLNAARRSERQAIENTNLRITELCEALTAGTAR